MANVTLNLGNLDQTDKIVRDALAAGLNAGIVYLQGAMRTNMGTSGGGPSGQLAYRYKKKADGSFVMNKAGTRRKRFKSSKATYTSSTEGGFPGIRTGRLRQSIGVVSARPNTLLAVAGTNLEYGRHLEYGTKTKDGKKLMAARPWALRSLEQSAEYMIDLCKKTAARVIIEKLGVVK